jgi:RNA polymerase-binding protein DksA
MTKKQLEYLKQCIMEKCEKIAKEFDLRRENGLVNNKGDVSKDDSTYAFHMADQGTDTMEQEQQYMFATREGNYYHHLQMALERIESGEYGNCVECGEEINFERLEAVPHARLCIDCKSREEIRKR